MALGPNLPLLDIGLVTVSLVGLVALESVRDRPTARRLPLGEAG